MHRQTDEPKHRGTDIEPRSLTHTFPNREAQEAEVSRLIATPPRALHAWLRRNRLELADAKDSRPHVENWGRSWRKNGIFEAAHLWLKKEEHELHQRWRLSNHKKICRWMAWRFVEAKMADCKPSKLEDVPQDSPELDVLPSDLRWVYCHPGLFPEMDSDPVVQARVTMYTDDNPPPSNGAINWRDQCRLEKGARQKMFDEVKAYLLENRKKKKEAPNEGQEAEAVRVLDMKAELAKLKGAG